MSLLWDVSTDSVVTTLIVLFISALAIAWLFAGRRRPAKDASLEERRLAGREADVYAAPMAPPVEVSPAELSPAETPPVEAPFVETSPPEPAFAEMLEDAVAEAPRIEPAETITYKHDAEAKPAFASEEATHMLQPLPTAPPAPTAAPPAHSPEKASAMSIAAALVRHDKRGAPPSKRPSPDLPLQRVGSDGDDLTAISGIDRKLAKEMNDLGIRYFDQIVEMSPDHAAWIASRVSSTVTSAQRAGWIAEAKEMAEQPAQADHSTVGRTG